MPSSIDRLVALGQSVWIDTLPTPADLDRLVRDSRVTGATTNPTILERTVAGDAITPAIQAACDRFAATFTASRGHDGFVSLEVDPAIAGDASATVEAALRLRAEIDRPNLLVKIPATEAGVDAVEEMTALSIPVNVTLLFSLDRHRAVAEAYLRGIDRGGRAPSVASFFVSRVDTETDARLAALGAPEQLFGRLAIANAKLAYRNARRLFAGCTHIQRCLWASTSAKDPRYRDVRYVEELIGPGTINTMPLETLRAFAAHGRAERTLDRDVEDAERTFAEVTAAGIDYDDVTRSLEEAGLAAFAASWDALSGISARTRVPAPGGLSSVSVPATAATRS
ncbi:transaldolase family protein [Solirubrobacter soli]|uniref:transaldolase family protein n=1 Tax=Solirubrobacter soli TaxID=363832 RepID=UPI0005669DFB|nr:transaldolase family protein [Solirubrobacter soli]